MAPRAKKAETTPAADELLVRPDPEDPRLTRSFDFDVSAMFGR